MGACSSHIHAPINTHTYTSIYYIVQCLYRDRLAPQLCLVLGWVARQCCYLTPGDVILAQLACPLNDLIFCLHQA